ncbi:MULTISPECIES: winged helix-turn-helix domain-containing protein [unclassified Mesorhizobium]|uniref:winged helix-turn-helix domain-containing tetratricopeptide repeat protein n=1 Tax=unclassified Mesorhizobium TaxID=325217 RepID=UPI000FCB951C|nr:MULTISPECIES: winged helix-turn-helix domain-containing protein [unclassified Mesorhizobium]RUW02302.1 transcriptional regulator [Mesorhizobium sp. M1A.F.Ca.IN.020.04.1.1]RUW15753.1 transcriptional regulator [Mesorhizobium sp. M1A.F.Ca.IN.020.03.1.1]RWF67383.1 MAG: transcriptional regulator [Mesorhizobium sp.]RWG18582.1 MAG: transcriptional regulator [Mesorhizobium sp.]RWG34395.1 MAG: transcriptional regulator [Mesorhizobium sp.]
MDTQNRAFGPFEFITENGCLLRDNRPVALGARGASLLAVLLAADGRVVTKSALMEAAWPGLAVEESNLSVQIAALRKLLGPASDGGEWIVTVPRVGYRFFGAAESRTDGRGSGPPTKAGSSSGIAVLPFENLGGDAERQYLADGIADDLIMALARFRWFRVASRGASFARRNGPKDPKSIAQDLGVDFLVDGAIRNTGDLMRISVHLADAMRGSTIWSEHYDLQVAELFAVQDAIAERIAASVEPELLLRHGLQVAPHTGNVTAWDLVRQGTFNFHKVTQPTHLLARRLFREAAELDPMLPEAQIWRARVNAGLIAYDWTDNPFADGREGLDAALRAIYLDARNPYAHYALAIVSAYTGRADQAILAAERSIELGPSFALGYLVLGMAHLFAGDAASARKPLTHGLELNPHDPQNAVWFSLLMLALFFSGDVEGALGTGRAALKARPDWPALLRIQACCHMALGHGQDAYRFAAAANDLPQPAGDALGPFMVANEEWASRLEHLLREAKHQRPISGRNAIFPEDKTNHRFPPVADP